MKLRASEMDKPTIKQLVRCYFYLGLKQKDILYVLANTHKTIISESHLKRLLKSMRLFRYSHYSEYEKVFDFIIAQMDTSGQLHGYRWMYTKCMEAGIPVRKEDVRFLLNSLDPEGVSIRRRRRLRRRNYFSRGPNYIWHVDSYDKLKPYGLCINGCIDGFSRKIIWLNVYFTSSDPRLIGGYYINGVEKCNGCPRVVRCDFGTENVHIRDIQRFFRTNGTDEMAGEKSYLAGASTANQRIESWWGFLRRECIQFWLCMFSAMKDQGLYDGGFIDKNLMQFCFLGLLQDELDEVVKVWDSHIIRPSKNDRVPSGKPKVMYFVPELHATVDHIIACQETDIEYCKEMCVFRSLTPCDIDVYDYCNKLMLQDRMSIPCDPWNAKDLYIYLRQKLQSLLS